MLTLFLLLSVAFAEIPRDEVSKRVMKNEEASGENPYGEKDDEIAKMKYLINDDVQIIHVSSFDKCARVNENEWEKTIPYNQNYYIVYTYNNSDCSGDPMNEEYYNVNSGDQYANEFPAHIAYIEHFEEDNTCKKGEGFFTLFTDKCDVYSSAEGTYCKYEVTDDRRFILKTYPNENCTSETSGSSSEEEEVLGEFQCDDVGCSILSSSGYGLLTCSEYGSQDDGDKASSGTTNDGDGDKESSGTTNDGDKDKESSGTTNDGDKDKESSGNENKDDGDKDKASSGTTNDGDKDKESSGEENKEPSGTTTMFMMFVVAILFLF